MVKFMLETRPACREIVHRHDCRWVGVDEKNTYIYVGKNNVVKLMLETRPDLVDLLAANDETCLHKAARYGHDVVCCALLQAGAAMTRNRSISIYTVFVCIYISTYTYMFICMHVLNDESCLRKAARYYGHDVVGCTLLQAGAAMTRSRSMSIYIVCAYTFILECTYMFIHLYQVYVYIYLYIHA